MSSASDLPDAGTGAAASDDEFGGEATSREEAPAARRPQRRAAAAAVAATAAAVAAAAASPPREDPPSPAPPAAAAAAPAPRRRGPVRGASTKEALLNPPRPPRPALVPQEPPSLRNLSPAQAASQYQGAALRLQGTLTTLQHKIDRRSGAVSADDLDLVHRQFEAFVNLHPLYSPAARRARVVAAAEQAAEAAAAQRRAVRTAKKRRPADDDAAAAAVAHPQWHKVAGSLSALAADAGRLMGATHSLTQHGGAAAPPPAPVWGAFGAVPPPTGGYAYGGMTPGAQALSQHSMHSTISSYAPHMSADPLGAAAPPPRHAPAPGPEDSAAIAMATAAAMANAGGGGLDPGSAHDLMQMLRALGYAAPQEAGPVDGGADELAATALMSLGEEEPPPRRGPGRPPKRPAPAPPEGVPPAPEIDRSVESQLLALLVQGLGPGRG